MKEIIRKNISNLPYSLHDAHINNIIVQEDTLIFYFDKGYYVPKDGDCMPIQGSIKFEDVDLDYCYIYTLNTDGHCGTFKGEKYQVIDFIQRYSIIDMEIIDESYGYNQSKFSGYSFQGKKIQEFIVEIYHLGNMKYIVEE